MPPETIGKLTDAQVYDWYFRRHDDEADAHEAMNRMIEADRVKTLEQKREEHLAMCRSFGFTEQQAEAEWRKWLADNGGE